MLKETAVVAICVLSTFFVSSTNAEEILVPNNKDAVLECPANKFIQIEEAFLKLNSKFISVVGNVFKFVILPITAAHYAYEESEMNNNTHNFVKRYCARKRKCVFNVDLSRITRHWTAYSLALKVKFDCISCGSEDRNEHFPGIKNEWSNWISAYPGPPQVKINENLYDLWCKNAWSGADKIWDTMGPRPEPRPEPLPKPQQRNANVCPNKRFEAQHTSMAVDTADADDIVLDLIRTQFRRFSSPDGFTPATSSIFVLDGRDMEYEEEQAVWNFSICKFKRYVRKWDFVWDPHSYTYTAIDQGLRKATHFKSDGHYLEGQDERI